MASKTLENITNELTVLPEPDDLFYGADADGSPSYESFKIQYQTFGYLAIRAETTAYTATNQDNVILCNGTFTVTLPTAVGRRGKVYYIKNNGVGIITIDGDGSETIDGATTKTISSQYDGVTIVSDNTNWYII